MRGRGSLTLPTTTAYVGLGSNLGDRQELLRRAARAIAALPGVRLLGRSSIYETEPVLPVGAEPQPGFLNAALSVETTLAPDALMGALLGVEAALGRERGEHAAPRSIDLDLLLFGHEVLAAPDLLVPHPALHERLFVLVPLNELDPSIFHPAIGRSVRHLLEDLRGGHTLESLGVRRSDARW